MTEIIYILTDPAHWIAEIVMDTVYNVAIGIPVGAWWVRRHDRKHHEPAEGMR